MIFSCDREQEAESMRKLFYLAGAAVAAISAQNPAFAQSRDGQGYVDILLEEEPAVEESAPAPGAVPAPQPAPVAIIPPQPPRPVRPPSKNIYVFEDKALDAVTSRNLESFGSEAAFRSYLKRLDDIKDEHSYDWAGVRRPILVAASMQDSADEPVCAKPEDCPEEGQEIVMTASKVSAPTSITNVQAAGVDEGDIVKQIGDYFLILQDGRIFAVNTKTMQLTDRTDVYRKDERGGTEGADWYDEMLVQDDHVLITAYSYMDDATEFSIFKLDQASGKISPQGVFLISSDDYYDSDNYATRIVGDRLVVYTPYSLDDFEDREDRPVIRRWLPEAEREKIEDENDGEVPGKQLFGARDIFKPVLRTGEPTIHTVSVCPLGDYKPGDDLSCRTTGIVGPASAEMYVSPKNVYLWNSYDDDEADVWSRDSCEANQLGMPKRGDTMPGALFRMNIRSGDTQVAGVNGGVFDQFSMEEQGDNFYALSPWRTIRCEADDYDQETPTNVAMLSLKDTDFGDYLQPVADRKFTAVPVPQGNMIENRFVGDWLVYGGRTRSWWWSDEPDEEALKKATENGAIVVPLKRPKDAQKVPLGHSIVRLERLGDDAVLNGYKKEDGLNVSLLKLGNDPKISSSAFLPRRFESESRSHAFNGITDLDGSGVMGIPTVLKAENSDRYAWWSGKSDLSFLTLDPSGQLALAGELEGKGEDEVKEHESYKCEVSCIDWYGNARPIFTRGRIFGLMGTTLVEAQIRQGKIAEVSRIDLTAPVGTSASIKIVETAAPAN
jgi:Beta propeller domain